MRFRSLTLIASLALALTASGCAVLERPKTEAAPITGTPASGAALPPLPAGKAPTQKYDVATRTDNFNRDGKRPLKTTTWYPRTAGKYPMILFSHGLQGLPADFAPLLKQWAAAGFVVVAPAYPKTSRGVASFDVLDVLNQPADASFVITQTLSGEIKDRIDPDRIGAAGHSGGAVTTIGLFTIGRDSRLRAGVVFAGTALGVGTKFLGAAVPLFFVHGDADEVVDYASGKQVFDALPWPKALLTLPGQNHSEPYQRESSPAYKAVATSSLDFLRYTLYGDADAKTRIANDVKPNGVLDNRL